MIFMLLLLNPGHRGLSRVVRLLCCNPMHCSIHVSLFLTEKLGPVTGDLAGAATMISTLQVGEWPQPV